MTAAVDTVTSTDGTRIAFERTGQGPPVIVVGGALTDRSAALPVAAQLATDFTAYAYDRRGRGDSGDTAPYAVAREIEDLAALIAEAGGEAYLYGVSSGAILAFEAVAAGLPVPRLALFEPPYSVSAARPNASVDFSVRVGELLAAERRDEAVEYFLTQAVGLSEQAVAGVQSSPVWSGMTALAHTLTYDLTITGDGSLPAGRMASVTVPTLVLASAESTDWLREAAQAVGDAIPDGRYRALSGEFHDVPPAVLAPVLAEFLRQ